MAWNEPGGNDNDPWGNRKPSGGGNNGNGPPDLDEVFKNLRVKLDRLLGKRGGGSGGGSGSGLPGGKLGGIGIAALAFIALLFWLGSGFYIVEPAQSGVVTRFGAHTKTTGPGLHWHIPSPIESVDRVDVEQVRTALMNQQLTLTQDENLVKITLSVQYNIKNAEDYLFNVARPDSTLEQVVESAVREAIGQTDMESILTSNLVEPQEGEDVADTPVVDADALQQTTFQTVQQILDDYKTGLVVTAVSLEQVQPPDEVQAAFSDAIKAREDKERFISEAEAYSNEILPRARGDAERIKEEAEGYKTRVEQSALGESERFLSLLREYEKAPDVTRERLYIEAMESVLTNTSKVLVDSSEGNNNLMYLPIDKLVDQSVRQRTAAGTQQQSLTGNEAPQYVDPTESYNSSGSSTSTRINTRSRTRGVVQ